MDWECSSDGETRKVFYIEFSLGDLLESDILEDREGDERTTERYILDSDIVKMEDGENRPVLSFCITLLFVLYNAKRARYVTFPGILNIILTPTCMT